MHLKIRCDGESEKFCKIFWELNKAYTSQRRTYMWPRPSPTRATTVTCLVPRQRDGRTTSRGWRLHGDGAHLSGSHGRVALTCRHASRSSPRFAAYQGKEREATSHTGSVATAAPTAETAMAPLPAAEVRMLKRERHSHGAACMPCQTSKPNQARTRQTAGPNFGFRPVPGRPLLASDPSRSTGRSQRYVQAGGLC